jgi:hypothetical protein
MPPTTRPRASASFPAAPEASAPGIGKPRVWVLEIAMRNVGVRRVGARKLKTRRRAHLTGWNPTGISHPRSKRTGA